MKRSLSVFLCAVLLIASLAGITIPATAEVAGEWQYTLSESEATVTGYNGTASELTVPDTLGGLPVTAIGASAFENNATLTAVTLPTSVALIDECAFMNCAALESIHVGNVRTIGYSAFHGCEALRTVSFDGSVSRWAAVSVAAYNDPLLSADVTCLNIVGGGPLLPADASEFYTLSEGNDGGVIQDITPLNGGYRFTGTGSASWPSAYTRRDETAYMPINVFSDLYLNYDFTVADGMSNIIIAFGGMDIVNLRTIGHYVTLNHLIDPSTVDENGVIYDIGAGTYTASVHVGALGCDPSLVKNGVFEISDIKIYCVNGATVTVRDLSIGEAAYDILDLPQTSYTIKQSQSLLPATASGFAKGHTDTGSLTVSKQADGFHFASTNGWPCGYTTRYQTGEGYILADPDDYLYYDFTVYGLAQTHIAVYFAGTYPVDTVAGTYASLNPLIHPDYIDPYGNVVDLNGGVFKGFIKVSDLGCDPALMQDGKVPISGMKVFAVNKQRDPSGVTVVHELAVVQIETYSNSTTATSTTTSTTSTSTTSTTAQAAVVFTVSSHAAQVGETVTVDITVSDDHYLTNGQLWIEYDPAALELTALPETVNPAMLDEGAFWACDTPAPGKVKFAFADGSAGGSAVGGTLFSLTFTVLDGIDDSTALSLSSPEMCSTKDDVDYDTDAMYVGGAVIRLLRGDVTLDGDVDLADAARLFYHISGHLTLTDIALAAADYIADGTADMQDITQLFYDINGVA